MTQPRSHTVRRPTEAEEAEQGGPNLQAHLPSTQSNAAMTDPSEDHEETESENDGMHDRTTGNKNKERFATMQGDRTRPQKPRPPTMTATRDGNVYGRKDRIRIGIGVGYERRGNDAQDGG
jgi:hypothetical protein